MSQSEGGLGGGTGRGIRDTRLVERALRERWPIPKALRRPLIERLSEIVRDPGSSPREATSAAKAILTASKINLETIAATIKAQDHESVEEIDELWRQIEELRNCKSSDKPRIVIPDVDDRFGPANPAG